MNDERILSILAAANEQAAANKEVLHAILAQLRFFKWLAIALLTLLALSHIGPVVLFLAANPALLYSLLLVPLIGLFIWAIRLNFLSEGAGNGDS